MPFHRTSLRASPLSVLLSALAFFALDHAEAQIEVSWAHTVQGAGVLWTDYWHDAGNCAVDPWGNLAIASYGGSTVTMNSDGPPLVIPNNSGGGGDAFLGRYRADGTPSWGFWLGSEVFDAATGVAADNEGNIYLSMIFDGEFDMDPGPDTALIAPADGDRDLVIIKYDSTGQFLHAIHLVATYNNPSAGQISRMGFDADNNLYIGGFFRGQMDVDPGMGEVILTGNGTRDCAFVAKYDPEGNLLDHLLLRSTLYDSDVMDIVVEPDGSFFITGIFSGGLDLDNGPDPMWLNGPAISAFAAFYHADFSPQWGVDLEGGAKHRAFAACRGASGGYIITGQFDGDLSVPLSDGTVQDMVGPYDEYSTFLAALDADGGITWFKQFVPGQRGDIKQLAAKDDGTFYAALDYFGPFNLDPGASDFTVSTSGFPVYDMGLARYTMETGEFEMGHAFTGGGNFNYNHVQLLGSAMYMSGSYSGSLHPDIPATSNVLTPGGLAVIKYCHVPQHITYSVEDTLTVCPGDDAVLVAYGAEQFRWYGTASGGDPIAISDSLLLEEVGASLTVYVEGVNGTCTSQRVALTVEVRPHVTLAQDSLVICAGDTVLLDYSGLADAFLPSIPEAFSTGFAPQEDVAVWITARDVNGCTAVDTATIHVLQPPSVSLELSPNSICLWDAPMPLAGASPPGGNWTGEGLVNDSLWSPLWSGPGEFPVTYTVTGSNGCSATATDTLRVLICITGITERYGPGDGLSLYPVPASNWIALYNAGSGSPVAITVLDAQGRQVLRQPAAGSTVQRVDISTLANGRYLMHVELADPAAPHTPARIWSQRFVVMRDQ